MPLQNLPVNKRLRKILAEFNLLQNLHLCAQKSVCSTNFGPLGEIGANFSLQLSARTQFAKINNKKVIAENQCEKNKILSLGGCKLQHIHVCDYIVYDHPAISFRKSTKSVVFNGEQEKESISRVRMG